VNVNINIFDTQHPATNNTTHREKKQKKQTNFFLCQVESAWRHFFLKLPSWRVFSPVLKGLPSFYFNYRKIFK